MKIGIYGGSFDPVHNGHINLARYVLSHTDLDEIWLIVSPLNPLKPQGYVASDNERLDMARIATEGVKGVEVSDFEFSLPIPSYTYNTLSHLRKQYPEDDFKLVIGGDNWASFANWRNPGEIISEFGVIVYPRPGDRIPSPPEGVEILYGAPMMQVSSTALRRILADTSDKEVFQKVKNLLPDKVVDYIRCEGLYQPKNKKI